MAMARSLSRTRRNDDLLVYPIFFPRQGRVHFLGLVAKKVVSVGASTAKDRGPEETSTAKDRGLRKPCIEQPMRSCQVNLK